MISSQEMVPGLLDWDCLSLLAEDSTDCKLALSVFGRLCINAVLLPLAIANVVYIKKMETTSFLYAQHSGHQKDAVICQSGMAMPDAVSRTPLPSYDKTTIR